MSGIKTIKGRTFDRELAQQALEKVGINPTATNVNKAVARAPDLDGNAKYVGAAELSAGAAKLASELAGGSLKASKAIAGVVSAAPSELSRYKFKLDEDKTTLTIDPGQKMSPVGVRATRSVNIGRTDLGGVKIQITGKDDEPLAFTKGKWATTTLAQIIKDPKDLARVEASGYNITALRKVLVAQTEDGQSTFFALRQNNVDANDPNVKSFPGFSNNDDATRGMIAICSEVTIAGFDKAGPIFTVRKPVLYLYPEKTTRVTVRVRPEGEFIAQYPEVKDGTWEVLAAPDGMLLDPATEKRYAYLFWEGSNPGGLSIDRARAFAVRREEMESFLETSLHRLGLTDRERTDFISYWIAALRKNPVSLVQFLVGAECDSYATTKIEPRPETDIRVFMLFEQIPDVIHTGRPELPEIRRRGFTAVEWGGANLDEV